MPDLSGGQKFSFPTLFDFYREVFLNRLRRSTSKCVKCQDNLTSSFHSWQQLDITYRIMRRLFSNRIEFEFIAFFVFLLQFPKVCGLDL